MTQLRLEKDEAAPGQETLKGGASFFIRLWAYGGPGQQLSGLVIDGDPEVKELIRILIVGSHGQITDRWPEGLVARFSNPLYALSAAKILQHSLLSLHRPVSPQQVVASILISGRKDHTGAGDDHAEVMAIAQMLVDGNFCAQILVSEGIYELAQNKPGFKFNSKPVREAGEGGPSEAVYELLWTDESTYGHLREAGQNTGIQAGGRYRIEAELGRGAMGIVYKAYDKVIGRTVALKTIAIDRNAPNRQELIERLKQEAKAAGGLDHPNIITIYDVGQENDRVYLSMQFVEGRTMQELLAKGELPPLPALISYAEQICTAVGFAHSRGVIHRDLKPANLMLTAQDAIKVLDFGIAKIENASLTQTGLVVGTPTHMAPEQAADKKIDHRTDIFALGSVFYELFTREKPFKGDVAAILYKVIHEDPVPPSVINPGLPSGIDAIIRKALAKNRRDRFQSCEQMGEAFRDQAASLQVTTSSSEASKTGAIMPVPRPVVVTPSYLLETATVRPQRRRWLPLAVVLLFAMAGAAGWSLYVKSQTGSFPPLVQKLVTAARGAKPQQAASASAHAGSASPQQRDQATQNSAANDTANPQSADLSAGSSTSANAGEAVKVQASQEKANTSAATSQAAQSLDRASPNEKSPLGMNNARTSTAPTSAKDAAKDSSTPAGPATESAIGKPTKKSTPQETAVRVAGFSRRDIPDLLRQADAAAARGDYGLARYEYDLILKLEHNNAAARSGLRRVQAAEQDQIPR